jgi:hypothetical protein
VSLPNDGQVLSNTDPSTGVTTPQTPPPTPAPQAQPAPIASKPIPAQSQPKPGIGNPQPAPDFSNHPAVKQAGLVSSIARTLAGNPQQVSIDPQTGQTTRTPATLTGRQIALAIALNALGGAAAGAGAKPGPGVLGRAAEAGFAQGEQRQQQNQQQQEQNAQQDYTRKAQVLDTNMRMHNNALLMGQQDKASNDAYVGAYKDLATKLQNEFPSYIKGYATYADLAKYNVTKENAIPYQVTPRMDASGEQVKDASGKPLWDINYMIVDPSVTSADLFTKQDIATANKYHLGNAFDNPNIGTSPMRIGMALNYKTQIHSLEMMDSEIDQYYSTLNANLPKGTEKLTPPAIGAATGVDSSLASALTKFQSALVRTQGNYTQALSTLASPTGQNDPSAAGKVAALLGGTANIQRYDKINTPLSFKTENDANNVIADPTSSADQRAQAQSFLDDTAKQAAKQAGAVEAAKTKITGVEDAGGGNAALISSNPPGGVNTAYLQSLPPAAQQQTRAIAEGREAPPNARTKQGQEQMQRVTNYAPDYDGTRFNTYQAMQKDFVSGKSSQGLQALNTALGHLGVIYDNANAGSTLPGISGVERLFGNTSATNLKTAQTAVTDELGRAYKSGVVTADERKDWQSQIDGWTPANVKASAGSLARLLDSKIASYEQTLRNGAPSGAVRLPALMSPPAATAYQHITGEAPTTSVGTNPSAVGVPNANGSSAGAAQIPAGAQVARVNGKVVGYKLPNGTYVSLGGNQ